LYPVTASSVDLVQDRTVDDDVVVTLLSLLLRLVLVVAVIFAADKFLLHLLISL
jgi:hypothetical protein